MAQRRLSMRKIREVLRLRHVLGKSQREISKSLGIGKTSVQEHIRRAEAAGISWPVPDDMTEEKLERRLYPGMAPERMAGNEIPFGYIYEEQRRPHLTMALLWEEYKRDNPSGYQYSWFCEQVRHYLGRMNYSMRQEHKAGEKGFVDFGSGLNIVDPLTGELIPTEIFIFVWGASQKMYGEAVLSEDTRSWIKVHRNALEYFDCCPKGIVPDNLKAGVTKACRYEPVINRIYEEFAEHYGTAILPARSNRPKDKALAELGVKLGKRWVLSRLRNRIFYSLEELNAAIREELKKLNAKKIKKLDKSRDELFLSLDKPNALSLPDKPYEYAEWKKAKVGINYHVSYGKHDYSVPYTLIHREVEIKATEGVVEIYFKGQRICVHRRSSLEHGYTTVKEHMPPSHQKYLEWTPERILEWAGKYGPSVKTLVECIMESRKFPEQAYKSCLGIIRLEKHYTAERLDAACFRALKYRALSYTGVKNILQNKLEAVEERRAARRIPLNHENIRGPEYFTGGLFDNTVSTEARKCQ